MGTIRSDYDERFEEVKGKEECDAAVRLAKRWPQKALPLQPFVYPLTDISILSQVCRATPRPAWLFIWMQQIEQWFINIKVISPDLPFYQEFFL